MSEKPERQGEEEGHEAGEQERDERKPYRAPRVTEYGRIQNLTLGFSGGGNSEDSD